MADTGAPRERRLLAAVFLAALALCALVTKTHVLSWNDRSRIATVDAIVADHTVQIDRSPYAAGLGDEIRVRGRTYSDKPPLPAFLGAAVALVLAPFGITLRHTPGTAIYLVTLLTAGVAFATGCCYAYAFQRMLGFERRIALAVAALSGTGTLALPYATMLTNHVPCGAAGLAACYHLYRWRTGGARQSHSRPGGGRADLLLGGFAVSLCYAFDAAGAVYALAAAILLLGAPLARWVLCAAAGLPLVGFQLTYNLAISGSVLPTVFNPMVWSDPTLPLHGEPGRALAVHPAAENLAFLVNLLVGARGLFSFTPLILVAAYGFVLMWRAGGPLRRLVVAIVATSAVYVLSIVFLQQTDAHAQSFGERRYVDLIFALCVALGPALASLRAPLGAWAVRYTAAASVAIAALGTVAPFAGKPGESGFSFGPVEFNALYRRAPVQAVLDVVLMLVLVVLVLRIVDRALAPPVASAASGRIAPGGRQYTG